MFLQHINVQVGNGIKIRFWEDLQVQCNTLLNMFPNLYNISSQQKELITNMDRFEEDTCRWTLPCKPIQVELQQAEELKKSC